MDQAIFLSFFYAVEETRGGVITRVNFELRTEGNYPGYWQGMIADEALASV